MQRYIKGQVTNNPFENVANLRKMAVLLKEVVSNLKFCRKILIPIHNFGHWHFVKVSFEHEEFRHYNVLRDYMTDQEVVRWV